MILIPITPVSKPRQTRSDKWKQRPCVMRYRAFADKLRSKIIYNTNIAPAPIYLTFRMEMPVRWRVSKKKEMLGKPHLLRPDVDNLIKAYLDALFENDSCVYEIHARKVWAHTGAIEVGKWQDDPVLVDKK